MSTYILLNDMCDVIIGCSGKLVFFYHINVQLGLRNVCCHIISILTLHVLTITFETNSYISFLFNIFVETFGGMTIAVKVDFLRNVSFYIADF